MIETGDAFFIDKIIDKIKLGEINLKNKKLYVYINNFKHM